jgi:hypothetical protein
MNAVTEQTHEQVQVHRIDCIPQPVEGSREPHYSLWLQGRQLIPQTSQPMVDARDRLQRLGYKGYIELWSVDKPYLIRMEPIR